MAGAVDAQDKMTPITVPNWGGMELQGLTVENDFRKLDVSVPLPALPYLPKLTFHRHAYETKGRFGGWQKGGARALKAHLPFGLEFEAGHRLDRFGHRESEFVGLSFTYSHLKNHHENWHYGRLGAADRGAPMPDHIGRVGGKIPFWQLARPIFLGAAMAVLLDSDSETAAGGEGNDPPDTPDPPNQPVANGWQIVWQDEFNGVTADLDDNWLKTDMYSREDIADEWAGPCFGGGNGEEQCYTGRSENVSVADGNLHLTALVENYSATSSVTGRTQWRNYTSGRIHTRGLQDFTYGRVEARIKLPTGQGTFPAFWMLPSDTEYGDWPYSGEIDIMENGSGTPTIGGAIHYHNPQSGNARGHEYQSQWTNAAPANWNIYRIDWHPDEINWYLNGNRYWTMRKTNWPRPTTGTSDHAPFDKDFHIILNLAIGGSIGGSVNANAFPDGGHKMLVDWVRVYECADGPNSCQYDD